MIEPSVVAFVFARGGSKGIPRKNLKLLNGKPLIAYSIEAALKFPWVEKVVLSTDDEEIAEVARSYGAEVPFMRPVELASDGASEFDAWKHAVRETGLREDQIFLSLPATAPLRNQEDIQRCIDVIRKDENTDIVITMREAERSPWFNMIKVDEEGYARLCNQGKKIIFRRQDVPEVFDVTTVAYVSRRKFILNAEGVYDGKVKAVQIPKARAVDIDDEMDFFIAEKLIQEKQCWM